MWLCKVDECVSIVLVSLHVTVLNEPLNLLLDHLLGRNEHVLENLNQFCLKGCIGKTLPHLHDLHYGLLRGEGKEERGREGGGRETEGEWGEREREREREKEREGEGGGEGRGGGEREKERDEIIILLLSNPLIITQQDNIHDCY